MKSKEKEAVIVTSDEEIQSVWEWLESSSNVAFIDMSRHYDTPTINLTISSGWEAKSYYEDKNFTILTFQQFKEKYLNVGQGVKYFKRRSGVITFLNKYLNFRENTSGLELGGYIDITNGKAVFYKNDNSGLCRGGSNNCTLTPMTPEEIQWLDACIAAGKLVEKPSTPIPERVKVFSRPEIFVGDIVVSLSRVGSDERRKYDLFEALPYRNEAQRGGLLYEGGLSYASGQWRKATTEEAEAYKRGIRNISDIEPKQTPMKKRVEDLKYPDVIHIRNKEEYDRLLIYKKDILDSYSPTYDAYLTGGGRGRWADGYQPNSYITYNRIEFSDLIFPKEEIKQPSTTTMDTYGLKVGDILPADVISAWDGTEYNHRSTGEFWTTGSRGSYTGDRTIKSFKYIDGILGFLVSSTASVYLRAEGFKEFMDNYYKELKSFPFKIGDWIIITRSNKNWCNEMDQFVGKTVQITGFRDTGLEGQSPAINFKDDGGHYWMYSDGHYIAASRSEAAMGYEKEIKGVSVVDGYPKWEPAGFMPIDYSTLTHPTKKFMQKPITIGRKENKPKLIIVKR